MSKKAFSLVELVMVIMFLGILATVAAIAVENIFTKGKAEVTSATEAIIVQAIDDYLVDYEGGAATGVAISVLRDAGYFKSEICDKTKNETIDMDLTTFDITYNATNDTYSCSGTCDIVIEYTGDSC